jgi:hypothetical protein
VVERSIYAEGTVDAVLFLAKKRAEAAKEKVYNMVRRLRVHLQPRCSMLAPTGRPQGA